MNDTKTVPAIEIRRTYKAPRQRVFDAWTKPEMIRLWFGPGSMTVPEATIDLRVGGSYRIVMLDPEDGEKHIAFGKFTTIRPPEELAYTWNWDWDTEGPDSLAPRHETTVTIQFFERGDETEMYFRHEGFDRLDSREGHEKGWTSIADNLGKFLAA